MKKYKSIQVTIINLLICLLISMFLLNDTESILAQLPQAFLGQIFYGSEEVTGIFDHNLPLLALGGEGNGCTQHNDGTPCNDSPAYGWGYDQHDGIDYDLNYRPVLAAANGTVAVAGWSRSSNHQFGLGLRIKINHANDYTTEYGHLSTLVVKLNQSVNQQNVIGISGSSGNSTGSHLHFGVANNDGIYVNPYGWQGAEGQDPWALSINPQGATSHDLWKQDHYPAITTGQFTVTGTILNEPPLNDYLIEMDDSDNTVFSTEGNCWTEYDGAGSINNGYHAAETVTISDCYARWTIRPATIAPAGEYDVYVNIPDSASTFSAFYKVHHDRKEDLPIVVQAGYADNDNENDGWAYIGRYYFRVTKEYIEVSNKSIDDSLGLTVVADAIRLQPVNQLPDLEVAITQSVDDAGGPNPIAVGTCSGESYTLNEIYLGHCSDGRPTIGGFRFPGVVIPDDVTVTAARLEFTTDGRYDNVVDVQFQGELADNAASFNTS